MKLKDGLEILLTDFNKAPFKDYDISKMKEHINEVLNKCGETTPERAFKESFKRKIQKMNSKESILLSISEKMFALQGEGV
jgi:hypothetical protein